MLRRDQPLAIYMEGAVHGDSGKMGLGIIRYSPNPVVCVIDSETAGQDMASAAGMPSPVPIVASVSEAKTLGAQVFVLGIAPMGGLIPEDWFSAIDQAWVSGMSIVNGLHDLLTPRYQAREGQWVWDIRVEPEDLGTATGEAAHLPNTRVLMIGADMAVGKMTAGLELYRAARDAGRDVEFIATGQIGITIMGRGVPLDAVRVDFACGAIEREVLAVADKKLVIVEGQGSLIHPGSTANLPLLRGSCPTHYVFCARAGQEHLFRLPRIQIPPIDHLARMYEDLAEACGTFPRPKTVGVALNTFHLSPQDGKRACDELERELGIPVVDPVRDGTERLLALLP